MIFDEIDGLVCDLDGVVYRGDEAVAGSVGALTELTERGVRILYCTNNSRSTVDAYLEKLRGLRVPAEREQILTSAVATAETLAERALAPGPVLAIGGEGVEEELARVGFDLGSGDPPELVVVGWDPSFDYDAMRRATLAVMAGATLIATNADASFPAAGGALWPGAGAILASIETASGVRAEVMGKPHPPMMDLIAQRLDGARAIAAVGDRPETDLAGARSKGWTTILVLTGVVTATEVAGLENRPDAVAHDLAAAVRGEFQDQ
jgi:HAD superfamily hydrolase (TIGR01450 family)